MLIQAVLAGLTTPLYDAYLVESILPIGSVRLPA